MTRTSWRFQATRWLLLPLLAVATPAGAAKKPQAQVTVFMLAGTDVPAARLAKVSHAFVRELRENPRLEVKDPDKLLVEFAGGIPKGDIEQAEKDLQKGFVLLAKGETIFALEQFKRTIATLEPLVAFIKKNELAEAYVALGVAQARAGNTRAAYATFQDVLTWRPRFPFDTRKYTARFLPLYSKAQDAVAEAARGSVELSTSPEGAKAYVDGTFVGITPTVAYGLVGGEHYATYKLEGYVKAATRINVSAKQQRRFQTTLHQSEKFLLLQQALERIRGELGQNKASPAMVDLRTFLFIDQAVFAQVRPAGDQTVEVTAYLYDLRSRLLLKKQTQVVGPGKGHEVEMLATGLFTGVRYDGTLELPPEPPPPPRQERAPIYKKWWFWTAVGVVAAGVIVPTVIFTNQTSCPDDYRCLSIQN